MNKLIAIYGPTQTGKLDYAVNIAKYLWGQHHVDSELISADSRKVYMGMNIVQSKLFKNLGNKIKLHLIDFVPVDKEYALYQFKNDAETIIDALHRENKIPILVGNTGTYILSIVENWNVPQEEVVPKGDFKKYGKGSPRYNSLLLCVSVERLHLYKRIGKSVDKMFEKGLCEEFLHLAKRSNLKLSNNSFNALTITLGYKEFFQLVQEWNRPGFSFSIKELNVVKRRIKTNMKNYARRQEGWFGKMSNSHMVRDVGEARAVVDEFMKK